MDGADSELAVWLCERVAALRGLDPGIVQATPLHDEAGGPVYCVVELETTEDALLVRMPDDVTMDGGAPDPAGPHRPAEEAANLVQAARLGLAPATLQFDPADGLWVYPLWPGVPINVSAGHDPEVISRIGRALRLLHVSGLVFKGHTDPFEGMTAGQVWHRETAFGLAVHNLNMINDIIGQCREVLALDPVDPVPCINAPAPEACFDTGTRVVFLDWRASAQGDPHHELARLTDRAGFNADQVGVLLGAYLGNERATARDRVLVYRLVAAYRRLLEQHAEAVRDEAAGGDPEVIRHRLSARLDACLMILESASWTGAMDRLSARLRPGTGGTGRA